jgi:hypothetical protein
VDLERTERGTQYKRLFAKERIRCTIINSRTIKMTIALTPENSGRLSEYANLIGWTPDELANHLLADSLDWFSDARSGILERFLGSIDYPDRETAEVR